MASLDLDIDWDGFKKSFNQIKKRFSDKDVMQAIGIAFERGSSKAAAYIIKNFLSGNPIHRRTGNLARSVEGIYEVVDGLPRIRVGVFRSPASNYASMLERGGTIYPKKAKALAMPVNSAVTPAGVSRFGDSPRNYPGELKFIPIRNKPSLVGLLVPVSDNESVKMQAAYLLLRKVNIKPRPYLREGVMQYLPNLSQEVGKAVIEVLNGSRI